MTDTLPTSFLVRAPTMDDLEVVTQLINICEIAQYGIAEVTREEMRTAWHAPDFDLATDAWVVLAPDGQLVAYAAAGHREYVRIWTEADVHPAYYGRGIGTHLLRLAEAWARQHITHAPADARVALHGQVSNVNRAAQQLFERRGYALVRRFWRMEIEMNATPPVPEWPTGVTVRTFVPGQERAIFNADQEAFQDHWGYMPSDFESWEHWMLKREGFDPTLWFLAFDGNELAGISLCQDEKDLGWVDTLAVRRPWRRQGLGMALLHHSFSEFYARGKHKVGLGVDAQNLTGATRLYERVGMHIVRQYSSYEKELRAGVELSTQSITA